MAKGCDKYLKKYHKKLLKAKSLKEKLDIINSIYEDGFEDGANNQ